MHLLEQNIDFKLMSDTNVIIEHYPLHNFQRLEFIRMSLDKHFWKLVGSLQNCFSNQWQSHIQPIHLIKRYNGEAFAFYYMYLLHYNTMLLVPAVAGLILFIYQISWYVHLNEMEKALDSVWNGAYGILISVWATIFVESWKNKQHTLIHKWSLDSKLDMLKVDEV